MPVVPTQLTIDLPDVDLDDLLAGSIRLDVPGPGDVLPRHARSRRPSDALVVSGVVLLVSAALVVCVVVVRALWTGRAGAGDEARPTGTPAAVSAGQPFELVPGGSTYSEQVPDAASEPPAGHRKAPAHRR